MGQVSSSKLIHVKHFSFIVLVSQCKSNCSINYSKYFRCDISWYDVKTHRMGKNCENVYEKDHSKTMRLNMDRALIKLQTGSEAAIVSSNNLNHHQKK